MRFLAGIAVCLAGAAFNSQWVAHDAIDRYLKAHGLTDMTRAVSR
jgi:hypothetical protein